MGTKPAQAVLICVAVAKGNEGIELRNGPRLLASTTLAAAMAWPTARIEIGQRRREHSRGKGEDGNG